MTVEGRWRSHRYACWQLLRDGDPQDGAEYFTPSSEEDRFSIIDGIQALYDRGPYIEPQGGQHQRPTPNCLLIGTDPVMMDQAMTDVIVRAEPEE